VDEIQSVFRRANQAIAAKAEEVSFEGRVPFLCECEDSQCREIVQLSLAEFEEVITVGDRSVSLPDHG